MTGRARSETRFALAALAAFVALGVTLVLHHEPWRDEADPWLMARDVSPGRLFRLAGYFGSPALWYYLQMPFAKLGFPYLTVSFLNLAFAAAAVALFARFAPFSRAFRLLFVFSYFMAYEYAVIARSYALSAMLLFAVAALDGRRFSRPALWGLPLFLLFNASTHGAAVAAGIALPYAWDVVVRRRIPPGRGWGGLALAVGGAALAAVQLIPPPDGQLTGLVSQRVDFRWIDVSLAGALLPTLEGHGLFRGLSWILFAAITLAVARSRRALASLAIACFGLWYVFVFKYAGELRHWGFILLAAVYALWVARAEEAAGGPRSSRPRARAVGRIAAEVGLAGALAWSAAVAFQFGERDLRDPFSGAKGMAAVLAGQDLDRVPVAAWPAPHAEAVLPYLPIRRFYYPGIRAYGSHMLWNRACVEGWHLAEDEVLRRVEEAFPAGSELLLLVNRPMSGARDRGFRLVHAEVGAMMMGDEQYFLYRREPRPERSPGRSW